MRSDDEERFEALFRDHFRRVALYALRRTYPDDAADVVASTFAIAWRKLAVVPTGEGALPWLLVTARHVLANDRRRRAKDTALVARLRTEFGRVVAERTAPIDEGLLVARTAFGALSPSDREVLCLVAWDGLSIDQVAAVIRVTPNAAAVRLHRARARFSKRLAEGFESDAPPDALPRPRNDAPSHLAPTQKGAHRGD